MIDAPVVLRVRAAEFVRDGVTYAPRISCELRAGERLTIGARTPATAANLARMLASIVTPTGGCIIVGGYDTRLQRAQARRLVAFASPIGSANDRAEFERAMRVAAAARDISLGAMRARVTRALAQLEEFTVDAGFARALAIALAPRSELVVLDRPPIRLPLRLVANLAPGAAIVACAIEERASTFTFEPPGTRTAT